MRLFCNHDSESGRLRGQLEELSKTVDSLRRERAALNTSFEELHDKVFRWMQRTNKRERDAERANGGPEVLEASSEEAYSRHPVVRRIMARRGLIPQGD